LSAMTSHPIWRAERKGPRIALPQTTVTFNVPVCASKKEVGMPTVFKAARNGGKKSAAEETGGSELTPWAEYLQLGNSVMAIGFSFSNFKNWWPPLLLRIGFTIREMLFPAFGAQTGR
jgi:hypothetical protein